MTYRNAKKLANGDEITIKKTGRVMNIVQIVIYPDYKQVEILCEDGNWYNHKEVC